MKEHPLFTASPAAATQKKSQQMSEKTQQLLRRALEISSSIISSCGVKTEKDAWKLLDNVFTVLRNVSAAEETFELNILKAEAGSLIKGHFQRRSMKHVVKARGKKRSGGKKQRRRRGRKAK